MTCRQFLSRTASRTTLIAALAAGPVAAEVTGPEVWADWKSYMEGFGYEMSGSESQSGGVLSVSDMVIKMAQPETGDTVAISLSALTFTDNPDGSVTVDLPPTMPVNFDMNPPEGEAAKGTLTFAQTGPSMVVSGDPDDLTYAYDVDTVNITLDQLEIDGEPVPRESMNAAAEIVGVSSVTRMQIGEMRTYTQDMSAGGLSYDIAFVVPEEDGGGTGSLKGSMQGLKFTGEGEMPMDGNTSDMNAMLEAGMNVTGGFSYEAGSSEINMQPPEGPFVATTTSAGGMVSVAMSPQGLSYEGSQTDLVVNLQQMPDIPFPVNLQMAKAAFNFLSPVQKSDELQNFAFGLTLGDFTVSDAIWNLLDPAGQLPRDPATIALDLTGKIKLLVDLTDPAAAQTMQPGMSQGEVHALDINNLLVAALGAKATGSGAFTFDNSDTTTFDGMPKPQGSLDVRVEGANALIDTLLQMGLLSEEQARGARMMMGLFGVPQGDDVLTSKIEVNEQGHVLANGQRLQ